MPPLCANPPGSARISLHLSLCAQSPSGSFQPLFAALLAKGASKRQFFFLLPTAAARSHLSEPLQRAPQQQPSSDTHASCSLCRTAARFPYLKVPTRRYKNASLRTTPPPRFALFLCSLLFKTGAECCCVFKLVIVRSCLFFFKCSFSHISQKLC